MLTGAFLSTGELPEWYEWISAPLEALLSGVPIAREVGAYVKYRQPLGVSPAFEGLQRTLDAVVTPFHVLNDDKEWSDMLWDFGKVAEFYSGIPAYNVARSIKQAVKGPYDIIFNKED